MSTKDQVYEQQMDIYRDFLINYHTYKIINSKLKDLDKLKTFWTFTNNVHVNMLILMWSKIYGSDTNNKTHWKQLITDGKEQTKYRNELYKFLNINDVEWNEYWNEMQKIRNKYIAHTELNFNKPVPCFDKAYKSLSFYEKWMKKYFAYNKIVFEDELEEYIQPYIFELEEILKYQSK